MSNPDFESPSSKSSELSDSSLDQVSGGVSYPVHKIERNIVISNHPRVITDVKTDAHGNVTSYTEVNTRNMEARPWQG